MKVSLTPVNVFKQFARVYLFVFGLAMVVFGIYRLLNNQINYGITDELVGILACVLSSFDFLKVKDIKDMTDE
jgi:hypothetical protein